MGVYVVFGMVCRYIGARLGHICFGTTGDADTAGASSASVTLGTYGFVASPSLDSFGVGRQSVLEPNTRFRGWVSGCG